MALQIAQWNLQYDLSSVSPTGSKALSFIGGNQSIILPTNKDVLVKKIALHCIYNQSGDDVVNYYSLNFRPYHYNNLPIINNNYILINPLFSANTNIPPIIELNKNNPIKNINCYFAGLHTVNNSTYSNTLIFNQTTNPLTNASFLLSIYYENE
jgi:hypothetical protein